MRREVNNALLKHAVQTAIFCRGCGTVLDCRTAVFVSGPEGAACLCPDCFEKTRDIFERHGFEITVFQPSRRNRRETLPECDECGVGLYDRDSTVRGRCGICREGS